LSVLLAILNCLCAACSFEAFLLVMGAILHLEHGKEGKEQENHAENEEIPIFISGVLHNKTTEDRSQHSSCLGEEVVQPGVGTDAVLFTEVINQRQTVHIHPCPEEAHQDENDHERNQSAHQEETGDENGD